MSYERAVANDSKRGYRPIVQSIGRPFTLATQRPFRFLEVAAWLSAVALVTGCSTHASRIREVRKSFYSGNLISAQEQLEQLQRGDRGNWNCVQLDRALIVLAEGRAAEAESILREVRDQFRTDDAAGVGEGALKLVTDDTVGVYRGEDYEQTMLRAMLALCNLLHDGGDAAAYCQQFQREQDRLLTAGAHLPEGETTASRVAMGVYLKGALLEATHRDYDAAERAFATVASWQPDFEPAADDLLRASSGVHSTAGNGVVYVWTFVNPGPQKVEVKAEATSAALLIADQLVSAVGDHTLPPTIAPVKIPAAIVPPPRIDNVAVYVDGQSAGLTQTITDVGNLAVAQSRARRDRHIAEAIARRVVKKAAVYSAKDLFSPENGMTNFAMDAVGVLWEATERADTRCWSLLPGQIQVLRIELPAGTHQLSMQAVRNGVAVGPPDSTVIEVYDGGNTYVLGNYPLGKLVGILAANI